MRVQLSETDGRVNQCGPLTEHDTLIPPAIGNNHTPVINAAAQSPPNTSKADLGLSTRGDRAYHRPPLMKCELFENQFSPRENPSGTINLGVAENSLMTPYLIDFLARKNFALEYTDFTYGTALPGSVRFFSALRKLTSEYFGARVEVEREHVIAGSGCGSVIDLLVSCLADEGDGILVSAPFFSGFKAAFECRNGVLPVGVPLEEGKEMEIGAIAKFEEALKKSEKAGVRIRAVMLCNPHNPLGFCYSKEVLLAYCAFCEKHNLHLISDEIYALSVYASPDLPSAQGFVSVLSLDPLRDAGCDPARVHCIYGSSKDWGMNGLRVGALISQHNAALHKAMESTCLLMKMSSAADILWSGLLLDPIALPDYIAQNQQRLSAAYIRATSFLRTHNIPYRPANAGHFVFVDLRRFLSSFENDDGAEKKKKTELEKEEALAMRFMHSGVVLARGTAYSTTTPGWFRLTFSVRSDYFEQGLARIEKVLGLGSTIPVDVVCLEGAFNKVKLDSDDIEGSLQGTAIAAVF